ncbi:MAG: rhamnogalacturonan acetylesterase [Ferruginibacter sp.]
MIKKIYYAAAILLMSFSMIPAKNKIKIFLAGDSTMSIKEVKAYPETGWGMPFANFWDSTVTVVNIAKNGRSTKSFIEEGLWKQIYDQAGEGDYVLIQFGHNDEVPTKKNYTTEEEFKNNLVRYVQETRSKKAIPVLITPVARREFDADGKIKETHPYAQLVRDVAIAQKTLLIDLDKKSMELLQEFGKENSKLLFNQVKPDEHPNYPEGKEDNTHFNELGARKMAEIVLAEIKSQKMELADHIFKPTKKL